MVKTYYPTQVTTTSTSEVEIGWTSDIISRSNMFMNRRWTTLAPLKHRANPATGGLRDTTQAIIFTGFNIETVDVVNGIKLEIMAQRNGRVADETVQLCYQGVPIGANNFQYETDADGRLTVVNHSIYGGLDDLWGAEITPLMLQDSSFGVFLRFQSHPYYPHSSTITLDMISLTIY